MNQVKLRYLQKVGGIVNELNKRKKYALIGGKLGHSYSPMIHKMLGDYSYEMREVTEENLEALIRSTEFDGFNVTIPYKKTVMAICDEIAPEAKVIGSVNVIAKSPDGKLIGYNSDYYGFKYLLETAGICPEGKKCIVLGTGGASVTVQAVLSDMKAKEIVVISRNGENNYENLSRHFDAEIIVNATPVGMYPNNGKTPISLEGFSKCESVAEVIYNPNKTQLLLDAEKKGIMIAGGLEMLVAQAKKTSELLTGTELGDAVIEQVLREVKHEMLNYFVIGESYPDNLAAGKKLAEISHREFIDGQALVLEKGSKALLHLVHPSDGKKGLVVALHEDMLKKEEYFYRMKENGIIYWTGVETVKTSMSMESKVLYEAWRDEYLV